MSPSIEGFFYFVNLVIFIKKKVYERLQYKRI